MSHLTPTEPSAPFLKHTNVSSPSVVTKPSLQSVTASEDYYSLSNSGSSTYSGEQIAAARSTNTIHRYQTPPSRYRTPLQSRDYLPLARKSDEGGDAEQEPEFRKTPMRGQGRRRQSVGESSTAGAVAPAIGLSGVRRKPVPSVVMEGDEWRRSQQSGPIDPAMARSSVAMDMAREQSPPTPDVDDTPYIRFALDQLTRDEEVRGSRRYRGLGSGVDGNFPYLAPALAVPAAAAAKDDDIRREQPPMQPLPQPGTQQQWQGPPNLGTEAILPTAMQQKGHFDDPPPRNPNRVSELPAEPVEPYQRRLQQQGERGDDRFLPVSDAGHLHGKLNFLPGILRPLMLVAFILALLAFLACLLFCAIWSLLHPGLWDYGTFGDGKYFVFQYLPTILGMLLFFWTVQIEIAVYRIAPFIAISGASPRTRAAGAILPMVPKGFVLPYFGHFKARQIFVGFFVFVAWLQIWTIPLLASSFNVYYDGSPSAGRWIWIATQGVIWTVIVLYLLLLIAVMLLLAWLKFGRRTTGLKWDPRSLADVIVLLERSNSLDTADTDGVEPAQLGYWRTNARPNEVFHGHGVANKSARRYSLEDGRIQEKSPLQPPVSRFSAEPAGIESNEQRHSREKMLPKPDHESQEPIGTALPWFLRPSMAALWIIIAIVLLLAFLIVSYLPSTQVQAAFDPMVPAPVNTMGFSSTNFLYSFLPALLGMLCLLFWMDIDYKYRRLQAYQALGHENGELAERSLLLAYTAEMPGFITATAAVNKHWRVAVLSFVTLLATTLPILAGGVFWAQFYVPTQRTRISAHMPAYYALTLFCVLYALSYLAIFPSKRFRSACSQMGGNKGMSFADVLSFVRMSRMLDDVAFHSPASKTALVTRLLSATPGARISQHEEAAASKVSVADSVRGFGKARQQALGGLGEMGVPRYALARHAGRDGREHVGIDRSRT
ncbi:hypothetical protein LTR17_010879 [Elasticomyces elasticus]|nr:hypothetical protein LTR17_010879 [Elasticomyces elasticus]